MSQNWPYLYPKLLIYFEIIYSRHLSRNQNNRISGLVKLILKSQLSPFFISYKNICLSRTWKNCNSRYVELFFCPSSSFDLEIYLSNKQRQYVKLIKILIN